MAVASLGFSFSTSSVIKKTGLVVINIFLMLLGIAVAVLSLYQVKLLPETYEHVVALVRESVEELQSQVLPQGRHLADMAFTQPAWAIAGEQKLKHTPSPIRFHTILKEPIRQTPSKILPTQVIVQSSLDSEEPSNLNYVKSSFPALVAVHTTQDLDEVPDEVAIGSLLPTEAAPTVKTLNHLMKNELEQAIDSDSFPSEAAVVSTFEVTEKPLALQLATKPFKDQSTNETPSSNLKKLLDKLEESLAINRTTGAVQFRGLSRVNIQASSIEFAHLPAYFEDIFNFVQTSLYVCIGAGLVVFLSALLGICGSICRAPLCLKLGVCGVSIVMVLETVTAAFIFVSHDKVRNRNKYREFDQTIRQLCDIANFCINPMMLVLTGSFLCAAVILQVGSVTLSCGMIEDRQDDYSPEDPNSLMNLGFCGTTRKWQGKRNRGLAPEAFRPIGWDFSGPMMTGSIMSQYPMMPMQNMSQQSLCYGQPGPCYFPPAPTGGSRPSVNIINT